MSMAIPQTHLRAHPGAQPSQQPQGNAAQPGGDAQPQRTQQHLTERLQGMINLMLVQTGRIFSDPSKRRGAGAAVTRQQLMQIFPEAESNFHSALDELEAELQKTQAVLRRDLALAKESRKRREEQTQQINGGARADVGADKVVKKEDISMTDAPQQPSLAAPDTKQGIINGALSADNAATAPAADTSKQSPKDSTPSTLPKAPATDTATSAPADASSPSKAAFASIDFESLDSLFADLPGSPPAQLPSTSPQPQMPASSPAGIPDPSAAMSSVDDLDFTIPSTGDVGEDSGLLASLENYSNIEGTDLNMLSSAAPGSEALKKPADSADAMAGLGDFGDVGDQGNGDGTMADQTLDDLFNSLDDLIGDSGTGDGDPGGDVNFDFDFT